MIDPTNAQQPGATRSGQGAMRASHELLNIVLAMRLRLDLLESRLSVAETQGLTDDLAALRAAVDRLAQLASTIRDATASDKDAAAGE